MKMKASKAWYRKGRSRIASGFDRIILADFDVLKAHLEFAEKSLSRQMKEFHSRFDRGAEGLSEADAAHYSDYMSDEYVTTAELLPRLQWYSQFLVAYATFEYMLNVLCRIVENRSALKRSVTAFPGQGIVRASQYLSKEVGVKAPFETLEWSRARLLGEVRNAIAHRNGEVSFENKKHEDLVRRLKKEKHVKLKTHIEGQKDAEIILDSAFVFEAIKTLRKVLTDVANYELYSEDDE